MTTGATLALASFAYGFSLLERRSAWSAAALASPFDERSSATRSSLVLALEVLRSRSGRAGEGSPRVDDGGALPSSPPDHAAPRLPRPLPATAGRRDRLFLSSRCEGPARPGDRAGPSSEGNRGRAAHRRAEDQPGRHPGGALPQPRAQDRPELRGAGR